MKLGAHFLPENLPGFLASVRAAEEAGYERAWLVDGQMLWQDLYVYMTHALAATERIAVGSGVTNPLTRHPSVTASAHATLADLHPGRVLLGIGRGDNAVVRDFLDLHAQGEARAMPPSRAPAPHDCNARGRTRGWSSTRPRPKRS